MAKTAMRKPAKKPARKPTKMAAKKPVPAAAAIRRLDADFMRAANARNAGALVAAFYGPDAVLMPPNHPVVEGRANIQAFLQGLMDAGLTSIKLETPTVESAGDLACGRGRYALSISPPGGAAVQDAGKYIVVYRRQNNGAWRAVADIYNSDQAAS